MRIHEKTNRNNILSWIQWHTFYIFSKTHDQDWLSDDFLGILFDSTRCKSHLANQKACLYAGAQKVIEGGQSHVIPCITLRWLKIRREIEFEAKMIRILSHLKVFELKKVSQLRVKARDRDFE